MKLPHAAVAALVTLGVLGALLGPSAPADAQTAPPSAATAPAAARVADTDRADTAAAPTAADHAADTPAAAPAADAAAATLPVGDDAGDNTAAEAEGRALNVSLLTFGPGSLYWERFGHNAILIHDSRDGSDTAYNYGIFDFHQKHFLLNFARGAMTYRIAADRLIDDLRIYQYEGRWVQAQTLNLSPAQRLQLRNYLRWNAEPENAEYQYDYFRANCSTRVRDALDRALGGSLQTQLSALATKTTYRSEALRLIAPVPAMMLAMDAGLGPLADRPLSLWQQSFVPMVLMQAVREARVRAADGSSQPLVLDENRWLQARVGEAPERAPDLTWPFLFSGLLLFCALTVLAALRQHLAARIAYMTLSASLSFVCGLCGLALLALWGLTAHWPAWHNLNLLLLNPLCLLLIPTWFGALHQHWDPGKQTRRLVLLIAALAALTPLLGLLPGLHQHNLHWVFLLLPLHLALALNLPRPR